MSANKFFGLAVWVLAVVIVASPYAAPLRGHAVEVGSAGHDVVVPDGNAAIFATTNKGELVAVDLAAGTATLIGQDGPMPGWTGISFDTSGNLFVTSRWPFEPKSDGCLGFFGDGSCTHLYRLDPATGGILEDVGSTGVAFVSDIDFSAGDALYGSRFVDSAETADGGLVYIDPATATAMIPPNVNFGQGFRRVDLENGGLSVHPGDGTLWGVESSNSDSPSIFRIDPASGLAVGPVVRLGLDGEPTEFGLDGLEILADGTFLGTEAEGSSNLYSIVPTADPRSGLAELTWVPLALDAAISGNLNGLDSPIEPDGDDDDDDDDDDEDGDDEGHDEGDDSV